MSDLQLPPTPALVTALLLIGGFSAGAWAGERSAADELRELEQYRFDEAEDISNNHYRSGNMNRKMLILAWEILKELKEQRRVTPCGDPIPPGEDGT